MKQRLLFLFEQNRISWNRNLITPGTKFMDDLNNMLESSEFTNLIQWKKDNLLLMINYDFNQVDN